MCRDTPLACPSVTGLSGGSDSGGGETNQVLFAGGRRDAAGRFERDRHGDGLAHRTIGRHHDGHRLARGMQHRERLVERILELLGDVVDLFGGRDQRFDVRWAMVDSFADAGAGGVRFVPNDSVGVEQ